MNWIAALALLASPLAARPDTTVAFVNVNVVPMDREVVLPGQTVLVSGGRITAVGPAAQVQVPAGAQRVDGTGRYLMPGLADMHAHLVQKPVYDAISLLYLANGVTTIRVMWGSQDVLALRREIDAGASLGPQIYTTGPINDGPLSTWAGSRTLSTAFDGDTAALSDARQGYDAVKVYSLLPAEAYGALVARAEQVGLPVYGHVPGSVGLPAALQAGQRSVEHLQGWVPAMLPDTAVGGAYLYQTTQDDSRIASRVDPAKLRPMIAATLAARAWNCPTLVVEKAIVPGDTITARLRDPTMRYVPPLVRASWEGVWITKESSFTAADFVRRDTLIALYERIVTALDSAGAPLLAGTDAPNPLVLPGFSLHQELRNLVAAGLTPYRALRAGTSAAADFLGRSERFGTVAVGRRADLLLLEANPLQDVGNAARRVGVMVNGAWHPQADLQARLERLAVTNLHTAAFTGDTAYVAAQVALGVPVDARDASGETPLLTASYAGQLLAMYSLLRHGAAVNAVDLKGETPLMAAAYAGQLQAVALLLQSGAAVNARNAARMTALGQIDVAMAAAGAYSTVYAVYAQVEQLLVSAGGTR